MRTALSSLTTRGRAFVSAGLACGVCALALGQKDLLRVAVLLLALPLVTALVAHRSRYLLSCRREISPERVQAGQSATVSLRVENPGRVPTGLMLLEDSLPYVLGSRPRFVIEQLRPRWQREIGYPVRSEVRGRYPIGPLTVRISDPFGFVEMTRSFSARTPLVVTPVVHSLPAVSLSGDWSGTGDNRPRAFASAGTEDITVREYRQGDDLRRIHWRSTARTDQLMVRREEQPHQSRATLLLDSRGVAHRGKGPTSSFEYAVSAAASIGAHLSTYGFVVRMVTERAGDAFGWHDRGVSSAAEVDLLLDDLAVITVSTLSRFETTSSDQSSAGLVVAVLGAVTEADLTALSSLRASSTRALAIMLDVAAWAREGDSRAAAADVEARALLARRNGWSVVVARPQDKLASVWRELARSRPVMAQGGLGNAATTRESEPAAAKAAGA